METRNTLCVRVISLTSHEKDRTDFRFLERTCKNIILIRECFDSHEPVLCALQDDLEEQLDVNNEMANRMSLFYAQATPMLRVLSDTTSKFVSEVSVRIPVDRFG